MAKKIGLKLNSIDNLEEFLQEIADEAHRTYNQINDEISKIITSTSLSEATIQEKAMYSRILHDYFTDKDRAHKARTDVAKIMTEILKFKGDTKKATDEMDNQISQGVFNVDELRRLATEMKKESDASVKEYEIKRLN